ncbi:hypothetical protein M3Y94_00455000 [Aphelenchoides besseyi]|nr:hypothetical protein M3Y94_00455000 [Aphelenchoides besseyi]KAI6229269.1 hypothetical protein M3Y95_00513300 [Aphelenchoides besseyi]
MNRTQTAREAAISVLRDTGSKVVLTIKIPGLKKKHSLLHTLFNVFKKANDPFRLSTNAHFVEYRLTETSLDFSVDVYEDSKARKERSEVRQNYFCKITQFPSRINPESAEFELVEGASGDCYFLLTCIKLDNLGTSWKEYQSANGSLDMTAS